MYLKSLELLGFKSFAPRTVMTFHRGVTAVVGPNGCGKSNILDAIRWVLGEQSAKALRGGEMADIIFNGSDSRKPVGMAEVSLTFSECEKQLGVEWSEVCITRRVYRDGKSEYRINKAKCRLKDIHNLFMDTGIGRAAYSIMEQGKLDQILSSKPDERRAIFEEAAGITKYKMQKKEALRKLDYTEANLLRVTDIIKEVKRQIGSLQRQAGKARRYQTLIRDLKILDTHYSRHRFDAFDSELKELNTRTTALQETHGGFETQIQAAEERLRERRREVEAIESEITEARQKVQDVKNRISNAKHRISFNDERRVEYQTLLERYQRDIAASEEKLIVQQGQIAETDSQLTELATIIGTDNEQLAAAQERTTTTKNARQELQTTLNAINTKASALESKVIKSRAQLESLTSQRDGNESRLQVLTNDIAQLVETSERLIRQGNESRADFEQSSQGMDGKRTELHEAEAQLTASRAARESLDKELNESRRLLTEKDSRLKVLQQLNDEGEGFAKGAQAVLKGLDRPNFYKPATMGALATLIETDAEFIPAIEAALDRNLQSIILKDIGVAEAAIEVLVAGKIGRASIAAPEIMPRPSDMQMEALPDGAIAWAFDKVTAPAEISPLLASLLGQVVIVPDLAQGLKLKRQYQDLAFATLTGETISRDGIISGGQAGGEGNSILQRKLTINELTTETAQLREEITALEARREEAAERLVACQDSVNSLRDELQKAQVRTSTLEGQVALMERELREANGRLDSVRWENNNLTENIQSAVNRSEELTAVIGECDQELAELQLSRSGNSEKLEQFKIDEESMTTDLNELRIKAATNKQRKDNLLRQRQPMDARIQELNELLKQRQVDIETYTTRITDLVENNEKLQVEIATAGEEKASAEQGVTEIVERRQGLQATVAEVENQLVALRKQLTSTQDERNRLEVRQTKIQLRIENLCEHITRRYQLDIREFTPDAQALLLSVAEQEKRRNRQRNSSVAATEEANAAAPAEGSTPEVEPSDNTSTDDSELSPAPQAIDPQLQLNTVDWELVEEMVTELSDRLDSMGPVNLDAIQEFEELEQRYNFLEEQFADLTNSKSELLNVIEKINTTTRKLFANTFEQIRKNFQVMFTELFGGGRANLLLQDDSDPLESGIEIIAKPPGKQLQSITLLSGGERTMTAVALMFSIYMVKPSPFCVLDEMDAPLDESNISRFIKILDRFVDQSQFVVITHNKRTIARADVLYGVTMEEAGVSKLVGVKLSQSEDGQQNLGSMEHEPSVAETFGKHGNLHSDQNDSNADDDPDEDPAELVTSDASEPES